MSANSFDTNVVLYLVSADLQKAVIAEDIVRTGGIISVQVLNESVNVLRRKYRMPWQSVHKFLGSVVAATEVLPLNLDVHRTGLRLAERYGFSVYDSFIVAAALQAGCDMLWSEDMQDGLLVEDQLRIVDPFKSA